MIRFLTAGESHGPALNAIIEGIPSGLALSQDRIKIEMTRRKKGYGRGQRQSIETDDVQVLSGVRNGLTLGSPISLMVQNLDYENWKNKMDPWKVTEEAKLVSPRPGHADLFGAIKYDHSDMRNVLERASARETTVRVAVGTICKILLEDFGIKIGSRVKSIGKIIDNSEVDWSEQCLKMIENSETRMACQETTVLAKNHILEVAQQGDSLGGEFEVVALNVPMGLGSYSQWDLRLDGILAQSFMSLNAIKSVEVGDGQKSATKTGRQLHDQFDYVDGLQILTNNSGGIVGGMSTGQPILIRATMKPLSTLKSPLQSVDVSKMSSHLAHFERTDVTAVPSAAVIGESLMSIVIANEILRKFGGDSMNEIKKRVTDWRGFIEKKLTCQWESEWS